MYKPLDNICILCLQRDVTLTKEHIFPEAAGGKIIKKMLCQPCNSKLGLYIDAPFLNQKPIQLLRSAYQIRGKTKTIPQPFSDAHTVEMNGDLVTVKLDSDFVPRVIPRPPQIWITENNEIGLNLSRDAGDEKQIPKIIRATISRFLASEEGKTLGWSAEKQEAAIERSIAAAKTIEPTVTHITGTFSGSWNIDFTVLFAEHVKVIYEICSVEYGLEFLETNIAKKIREFLTNQFSETSHIRSLNDIAQNLGVIPSAPDHVDALINWFTQGQSSDHHVAIVGPTGVISSIAGTKALFHSSELANIVAPSMVPKIYINDVRGPRSEVVGLDELIERLQPSSI